MLTKQDEPLRSPWVKHARSWPSRRKAACQHCGIVEASDKTTVSKVPRWLGRSGEARRFSAFTDAAALSLESGPGEGCSAS